MTRFEHYAENAGWSKGDYALYISSLLTGRSLGVYSRLPLDDTQDYPVHKQALALANCVHTAENNRRRFCRSKQGSSEAAAQCLGILDHLSQ